MPGSFDLYGDFTEIQVLRYHLPLLLLSLVCSTSRPSPLTLLTLDYSNFIPTFLLSFLPPSHLTAATTIKSNVPQSQEWVIVASAFLDDEVRELGLGMGRDTKER